MPRSIVNKRQQLLDIGRLLKGAAYTAINQNLGCAGRPVQKSILPAEHSQQRCRDDLFTLKYARAHAGDQFPDTLLQTYTQRVVITRQPSCLPHRQMPPDTLAGSAITSQYSDQSANAARFRKSLTASFSQRSAQALPLQQSDQDPSETPGFCCSSPHSIPFFRYP